MQKQKEMSVKLYVELTSALERMLKVVPSTKMAIVSMDDLFEDITPIFEQKNYKGYNIKKILKCKNFFGIVPEYPEEDLKLFIEFLMYKDAPYQTVISVSVIKLNEMLPFDAKLYVLKEEMVEKLLSNR